MWRYVWSRILLFYSLIPSELPSPQNLSINITKSSLTLYWTFNNSIDEHLHFTVYCSSMKVYVQQQSNVKSELTIQTKDNNAMLVGLSLNTTYTCCVSAVLPYMETESTCINITTGEHLLSYTTVIHISKHYHNVLFLLQMNKEIPLKIAPQCLVSFCMW